VDGLSSEMNVWKPIEASTDRILSSKSSHASSADRESCSRMSHKLTLENWAKFLSLLCMYAHRVFAKIGYTNLRRDEEVVTL